MTEPARLRHRRAGLAAILGLALTACSGSSSGDFCDVLTDNSEEAATVFSSPVLLNGDASAVQARLDLLGQIEDPPSSLAEPLQTWVTWLTELRDAWQADPTDLEASLIDDPAVQAASDELFEHYTGTCMG